MSKFVVTVSINNKGGVAYLQSLKISEKLGISHTFVLKSKDIVLFDTEAAAEIARDAVLLTNPGRRVAVRALS